MNGLRYDPLLTKGTDYSGVIAFVWDASRRVEEHALLREGLRQIRGVLGAVVVSRPGRMSSSSS
jgi:hypothetical protein